MERNKKKICMICRQLLFDSRLMLFHFLELHLFFFRFLEKQFYVCFFRVINTHYVSHELKPNLLIASSFSPHKATITGTHTAKPSGLWGRQFRLKTPWRQRKLISVIMSSFHMSSKGIKASANFLSDTFISVSEKFNRLKCFWAFPSCMFHQVEHILMINK